MEDSDPTHRVDLGPAVSIDWVRWSASALQIARLTFGSGCSANIAPDVKGRSGPKAAPPG